VYLGYLPLAHVLELGAETAFLNSGGCIGYGTPRTLIDKGAKPVGDIKAVSPTHMAGVPRVYETIRKGVMEKLESTGGIAKFLFNLAYSAKVEALKSGDASTPIWDWLLFSKFKEQIGGRMKLMLSGGAPLSEETQTFIRGCFDVAIVQGYGLTETTGGVTFQDIDKNNFSTLNAGKTLPCCELKLVSVDELGYKVTDPLPRGEILVKGNNICLGYYKNEKKTKEEIKEGWFSTGDIGRLNEDGSISIIDRKKNLVKLSHGEYVALENLEMIYGTSSFVSPNGICTYGDSFQDHVVAVVIPQKSHVLAFAKDNSISRNYSDILKSEKLKKFNEKRI